MQETNSKLLKCAVAISTLAGIFATSLPATAATPQNLSATIDGKKFESDDDGITYLIPTKGVLNLNASTKGASAYPPPKTPIDFLSVICNGFDGKPVKFMQKDFGNHGCEAQFVKGKSKVLFGEPDAEYDSRYGKNNTFEVTSVKGKVIEGKFHFEMKEKKPKAALVVIDGTFKAEDRQK